jgi:RNA polymerase sigma-70 factor (ECF subfamily)
LDSTERLLKLLDEQGPRLHRLLVRVTLRADAAEDLLQDLFLKLRASPGFAKAEDPAAFAVRAAVNLAFDWHRQRARRRDTVSLPAELVSAPTDPLAGLVEREQMEQLVAALQELPELQRLALVLRHLEHVSTEDVGKQLGKTPHQVRALCAKGLAQLRGRLSEVLNPEGFR